MQNEANALSVFLISTCEVKIKTTLLSYTVLELHDWSEWMDHGLKQQALELLDLDINLKAMELIKTLSYTFRCWDCFR